MRRAQLHRLIASNRIHPAAYAGEVEYRRALALAYKVSPQTIRKDLAALRQQPVCPVCGKPRDYDSRIPAHGSGDSSGGV